MLNIIISKKRENEKNEANLGGESSLSMETTTLEMGREWSEGGARREREMRGGHFIGHIALSAIST